MDEDAFRKIADEIIAIADQIRPILGETIEIPANRSGRSHAVVDEIKIENGALAIRFENDFIRRDFEIQKETYERIKMIKWALEPVSFLTPEENVRVRISRRGILVSDDELSLLRIIPGTMTEGRIGALDKTIAIIGPKLANGSRVRLSGKVDSAHELIERAGILDGVTAFALDHPTIAARINDVAVIRAGRPSQLRDWAIVALANDKET